MGFFELGRRPIEEAVDYIWELCVPEEQENTSCNTLLHPSMSTSVGEV